MKYEILHSGTYDGVYYKAGAIVDQLRRGVLNSAERMRRVRALSDEEARHYEAQRAAEKKAREEAEARAAEEQPVLAGGEQGELSVLDQPVDLLLVSDAAKSALKAAELLVVGDVIDYYAEHKTFTGLAGVGKKLDSELCAAAESCQQLQAEVEK